MTEARLRSALWVQAQVRLAAGAGRIVTVLRKGDADVGTLILKVLDAAGQARILAQATAPDGGLAWHRPLGAAPMPEADADAYIARQARYDPDVWALEILDRDGDWRPDGKILDGD